MQPKSTGESYYAQLGTGRIASLVFKYVLTCKEA